MLLEPAFILTVLLTFVRVSGVLVAAPFFRQPFVPAVVKVLVGFVLAYGLAGFVEGPLPPAVASSLAGFGVAILVEALTGLMLGFAAQFVFFAVGLAGELIGMQVGLSLAQAYNPMIGEAANPLGQLLSLGFLTTFVLLDGPQGVMQALAGSFRVVPLAGANLAAAGPLLLSWTGGFFATALRLAAPFLVTMLLMDLTLGVVVRVVPQLDLFGLGIPLKLAVGLAVFVLFVGELGPALPGLVAESTEAVARMADVLAPTP